MKYAFIRAHQDEFAIRNLCHMLKIHRSGYYAWLNQPKSPRQKDDERLLGHIKQFWLESGCVYGYRKIHKDLREQGETCGKNRVARLMKLEGLRAQVGYRKPRYKGGKVANIAENHLQQDFDAQQPNQARVGCFWQLLSTCFHGRLLVGQCNPRCTLIWHSMLC